MVTRCSARVESRFSFREGRRRNKRRVSTAGASSLTGSRRGTMAVRCLRLCSVGAASLRGGVPVRSAQISSWLDHYSLDELYYSAIGGKRGHFNRNAGKRGAKSVKKAVLEDFMDRRFQRLTTQVLPGINVPVGMDKKMRSVSHATLEELRDQLDSAQVQPDGTRVYDYRRTDSRDLLAWENRYEEFSFPDYADKIMQLAQFEALLYPGMTVQEFPREVSWKPWQRRGFSGTKIIGRTAGVPESPLVRPEVAAQFKSVVADLTKINNMVPKGRSRGFRAVVVIGNRNGLIGYGVYSAKFMRAAVRQARNRAIHQLRFVERADGHTIFRNTIAHTGNCRIIMHRKQPGYGLYCHRLVKVICELAGVKNLHAKIFGSKTPMTIVRTAIKSLTSQVTHQDLADKTGKHVVEMRPELGFRPIVVASPSSSRKEVSPLLKITSSSQSGMYGLPFLEGKQLTDKK